MNIRLLSEPIDIIVREMLVNTLIHREMTSCYVAKFVIEKDRMFVENANRAIHEGALTPEDFEPNTKNPLIASFFRNIGLSDQLGSGVRNLFKYGKLYSGADPKIIEGDVFKIVMPLNDEYSFDMKTKNGDKKTAIKNGDKKTSIKKKTNFDLIMKIMKDGEEHKTPEIAQVIGLKNSYTRDLLNELVKRDELEIRGFNRNRAYRLKK